MKRGARRGRGGRRRRGKEAPRGLDAVRLDVFQHLFASVAEEMGASLMRSSFSPNIRERRDFSCALFDGDGAMIGQASHLPVHLGSTPMSVAAAIDAVEMGLGDTVVLNDPYEGGTHLPDVTFVSPVFLSDSDGPDFFCANRAHHADVGGLEPGSMAAVPDVHGEGLRIPPVRLVRGGELDRELLRLLLANVRGPREREGDLLAQWATNRVGERRLAEMAREHGGAELRRRGRDLQDWTERLTRELLASLPDGEWSFEDRLDEGDARVRVLLEKRGDELVCDLRGTDALPGSSSNATRAVTVSAVFYVLRTLLPPFTPTNAGVLRPVRVLTEPGTLAEARYPAAVAAGNVETSQRIVDALFGALAQVLPDRIPAASAGTMSNLTFGGIRAPGGSAGPGSGEEPSEAWAYYETIAGGSGASAEGPGAHALQTHMTNTRNTPVEELECALPVRVTACGVRRGSGGRGAAPGGDGIVKRLRFLADAQVSFVGERRTSAPWGLAGAAPGALGRARVRELSGPWRTLPGRFTLAARAGTEVEIQTPGGGGHGAP